MTAPLTAAMADTLARGSNLGRQWRRLPARHLVSEGVARLVAMARHLQGSYSCVVTGSVIGAYILSVSDAVGTAVVGCLC